MKNKTVCTVVGVVDMIGNVLTMPFENVFLNVRDGIGNFGYLCASGKHEIVYMREVRINKETGYMWSSTIGYYKKGSDFGSCEFDEKDTFSNDDGELPF